MADITPDPEETDAVFRHGKTTTGSRMPRGTNLSRALFKGVNALSDWPRNRLLLALPARNLNRLMPELEQIHCQREQVLINADGSLDHVYFPDNGVVSVLAVYADGDLPLNFYPAAVRASANVTPLGAVSVPA